MSRHAIFKDRIMAFYSWRWVSECPWGAGEGQQLSKLLAENPNLDVRTFSRWLFNYGMSEDIAPGERPRAFLPRIHRYSISRLNMYGRAHDVQQAKTIAEHPTLEEVIAYCKERNSPIDGEHFWNYYEARNWKDIKKWKSAIVTWEKNQKGNANGSVHESPSERRARKNQEIADQYRRECANDDSKALF